MVDVEDLSISLIGQHSLWGHLVWNGARVARRLLQGETIDGIAWTCPEVKGKTVLELGAAGCVPTLTAAKAGAAAAIASDFPEPAILQNCEDNLDRNLKGEQRARANVVGYRWGEPIDCLVSTLNDTVEAGSPAHTGFDIIVLADLLAFAAGHAKLAQTTKDALSREPGSVALVSFGHHNVQFVERDLLFFDRCREVGLIVEKVGQIDMEPMFPSDPGEAKIRAAVHVFTLKHAAE